MDYSFITTEFDADNVDSSFAVNHGRTNHYLDLTLKTYDVHRIGDNIPTTITSMIWNDNLVLIQAFITREYNRLYAQLLLSKERQYELIHYGSFINVGPNDIKEVTDLVAETEATLVYLKNYKP
jgi:hypothetical protein